MTVSTSALLIHVMALPSYALFGGLLGCLIAPLSSDWHTPIKRFLLWLLAGIIGAFVVSLIIAVSDTGGIPTFGEAGPFFASQNRFFTTGIVIGVVMSAWETLFSTFSYAANRRGAEIAREPEIWPDKNDADTIIQETRKKKAEAYLESRNTVVSFKR